MNIEDVFLLFKSALTNKLEIQEVEGGFIVQLPFLDYVGDPIEVFLSQKDEKIKLDDLGHTAGILFNLNQHGEETPGHILVRNLAETYKITMDYNNGVLLQEDYPITDEQSILDFIKVLVSSYTVLPEMHQPKKRRRVGKRLVAQLGRDIKQLKLHEYVQRHAEIDGKHETWVVDYKYSWRTVGETKDILLVAVDLGRREPRLKAEHVLTLAVDVLQLDTRRDLRVVYAVNGSGTSNGAHRAAGLIYDYQHRIGYKAYNYAVPEQREEIQRITLQELSPLIFDSGNRSMMP